MVMLYGTAEGVKNNTALAPSWDQGGWLMDQIRQTGVGGLESAD